MIQLDDLSDLEDIFEPKESNNNEPNIVETHDNSEEIDILDDDFEFNQMTFISFYSTFFSAMPYPLLFRLKKNGGSGAELPEFFGNQT